MGKVKCASCLLRVDKETVYRRNGVQSFCSEDCFLHRIKRVKHVAKRSRATLGPIPADIRRLVHERDKSCRYCGDSRDGLHVHHILYRSSKGSTNSVDNLILLCEEHHRLMHSNKRKFLPLCQEVVRLSSNGKHISVRQLEASLPRSGSDI
jgi:hypothetical protein